MASAHAEDIFLSPHSDDVCFSLGMFALRRKTGTLLTVFPVSNYCATWPQGNPAESGSITRQRLAEDAAFAGACGLKARYLGFGDALERGHPPFDPQPRSDVADSIEAVLIRALMGPRIGRFPDPRPWLFCPAGIGGHVDHRAVLLVVLRHLRLLGQHYRIAFYEDLHYAADPERRQRGLEDLARLLHGQPVRRHAWLLDDEQQAVKLRLVRLYASQLTAQINCIAAYTPAAPRCPLPHEAAWEITQSDMHQRPG